MRSIRTQLTAWYAVALVATVLAFGVSTSVLDRRAKYAELDRRLTAAVNLADALMAAVQLSGGKIIHELSPSSATLRLDIATHLEPIADYLCVVDSAARIVYGSPEVRRLSPTAQDSLRLHAFAVGGQREVFEVILDGVPLRFVARHLAPPGPSSAVIASVVVGARGSGSWRRCC